MRTRRDSVMRLFSNTFLHNAPLPERCAFGSFAAPCKIKFGGNLNPHLGWGDLPRGTRSLALIVDDLDVPVALTAEQWTGKNQISTVARRSLCHWILINLAPDSQDIGEGEFSDGVYPGGKPGPEGPRNTRQGVNAYTEFFQGDGFMAGDYFGYDGPCPPAHDPVSHRYSFKLLALDAARLDLPHRFGPEDFTRAIVGSVLDEACIVGLARSAPNRDACSSQFK